MATDIYIDFRTRDFVDDPNGDGWIETDDASSEVIMQLECEEGRWWGDLRAGSRNAEIMRSEVPELDEIEDSSRRALTALVRAGEIANLSVTQDPDDERPADGFGELLIGWKDQASNKATDFAYSPLGGNPTVT